MLNACLESFSRFICSPLYPSPNPLSSKKYRFAIRNLYCLSVRNILREIIRFIAECDYVVGVPNERVTIDETLSNPRHLPNPEICRTRYLLYGLGFTRCLVENPDVCEFAERSPLGVYCEHPDRRKFDHSLRSV